MLWKIYIGAFLSLWAIYVFGFGHWQEVLAHWPMAAVMIPGSMVAGSTPLTGGTVAFPFLVLLFGQSAATARSFGFLIQAVGLSSATLFTLSRKVRLPWTLLGCSAAGATAGFLFGTFLVAPHVAPTQVKLLFSCLWLSFGLLTLARNQEICSLTTRSDHFPAEVPIGLTAGVVGGIIASMLGPGVEMMIYFAMVLLYRSDLRIAIPTAVAASALASIEGVALHVKLGDLGNRAIYDWLAAGPFVIFGAPLGSFLARVVPRLKMLYFVSALCVFQFFWTLSQTTAHSAEWVFITATIAVALSTFTILDRYGKKPSAPAASAAVETP